MELYLLPFYAANIVLLVSFPLVLLAVHYAGVGVVSLETQCLQLLAFVLRYLDLYENWTDGMIYRTAFKSTYLALSTMTVVYVAAAKLYDGRRCRWPTLLIPVVVVSAILALPLHYSTTTWSGEFLEFSWAMSEYVGGFALLPQLLHAWALRFLLSEQQGPTRVHRTMFLYLYVLLLHQLLYLVNWLLRYIFHNHVDPISIAAGLFRCLSIVVFLIQYAKRDPEGQVLLR